MSINSALVKLADKIDVDGKSTISPEYKNPNNSIEKSIERIAENYNGSGGGGGTGGGVLVCTMNDFTLDKTWAEIKNALNSGQVVTIANYTTNPNDEGLFAHAVSANKVGAGVYQVVVQEYIAYNSDNDTWGISAVIFSTDNENGYPVS